MRPSSVLLLASTATAFSLPELQPFFDALPISLQDYIPTTIPNNTIVEDETHQLLKRSTSCPNGFKSCSNLGAANLCCVSQAVCSADYAGNVACCPSGAACTGSVSGIVTAGTYEYKRDWDWDRGNHDDNDRLGNRFWFHSEWEQYRSYCGQWCEEDWGSAIGHPHNHTSVGVPA
ncbi:hypothetical protein Tdes44962_MAKER06597 [Teratosphaeria destructans]|uniref:Uncharacterized protein n=1 Tax=Teratosphaeria destructans TaxID=418781 RepID=A0A9W7T1S7_9PEZI|nr:hypothetical protein Tdes44962_MAKER06597 [Teratosphaeria destructans]